VPTLEWVSACPGRHRATHITEYQNQGECVYDYA
jgi:hypothetical protein